MASNIVCRNINNKKNSLKNKANEHVKAQYITLAGCCYRQGSCGKAMFSVMSVCHSVHRGVSLSPPPGPVHLRTPSPNSDPGLSFPHHADTSSIAPVPALPARTSPCRNVPIHVETCSFTWTSLYRHPRTDWKAGDWLRLKSLLVSPLLSKLFKNIKIWQINIFFSTIVVWIIQKDWK